MLSAQISHPLTKSMRYNDVTYLIRKWPRPSRGGGGKIKGFRFLLPVGPLRLGPDRRTPFLWVSGSNSTSSGDILGVLGSSDILKKKFLLDSMLGLYILKILYNVIF